ncbi:MAG: PH domain-containing protein [Deltaproteobacteria bacterium]|nr:PH domain-containing protein [Deltaproteobacteria bacterium]MDQ3295633.1 PH domain-containing protein [Myxococcota bacterium]
MLADRRLHPSAILFGAGKHIKSLALPLVLAVIGMGRGNDVWAYVFAAVLAFIVLHGLLQYATFRYQLGDGELVIRSGIVFRSERHVPYARIHNFDVSQHVIHRLFGVVEVRIQTGGGSEPEGVLRAIRTSDLDAMRERVRGQELPASAPAHRDVIAVPLRELVLAGLVELRGIALFAGGLGLVWELGLSRVSGPSELVRGLITWALGIDTLDPFRIAVAISALLVVIATLSVAWAIVRFYDFRVRFDGDSVQTVYGLLTRITTTIPLRRIQSVTVAEGPFHRSLGRVAVDIASAGGSGGQAEMERARLAPILPAAALPQLLHDVVPDLALDKLAWQPLAPRAGRRVFMRSVLIALPIAALSAIVVAWWWSFGILFALVALAAIHARAYMRHSRWAIDDDAFAIRRGWLWRRTTLVRRAKVQVVSLAESPFDRRHAMARLDVDTAGTSIAIPYLPYETAAQLHATIAVAAARTEFRW